MPIDLEKSYPTVEQLGGKIYNVRRLADPAVKEWSATNLSVNYHPSTGYIGMFRSGNYIITSTGEYKVTVLDTIRSNIYLGNLNEKTFKLEDIRQLDVKKISKEGELRRGLEDPKLFYRDGAWHFTAVTLEKGHTERARMSICKLNDDLTEIVSFEKFAGMDAAKPEKNWMLPNEKNPNFDWIYAGNAIIKDGNIVHKRTDSDSYASIRGNSNLHLLPDGTYLAVVHRMWTRVILNSNIRHYVHYFANYDQHGSLIKMSKGFVFEHLGTEFAAGLCQKGKDFLVSYGSKDVSSHIALLPKDTVLKSLHTIKD
jgi:hypothetical protein